MQLITTVLAQPSPSPSPAAGGGGSSTLIFFALMIGVFYVFMIRPQKRARRSQFELMRSLEPGDEIETAAGMFGTITRTDDTTLWVELAPGFTVRMARGAVRRKIVQQDQDPES